VVNQIWGKLGKLVGGLFLVGGGTVSLGILLGIAIGNPGSILLTFLLTLFAFFGLTPLALGGLLMYSSFRAERHAIRDRFFYLLQAKQGRLSVMDFAVATRLEPAIARRHMDDWAKEFAAEFEVTETGEIYYLFTNAPIPLPEARFQVIGQAVREVLRSL
jgi:hypothetical protein